MGERKSLLLIALGMFVLSVGFGGWFLASGALSLLLMSVAVVSLVGAFMAFAVSMAA